MADPSLFNDVLGPVMRGPSSSHTAAAQRIGRLARSLAENEPVEATIDYPRGSSLETTHASQGSDMGLVAGLLGWAMTDPRVPTAVEIAPRNGLNVTFRVMAFEHHHPNTYRLSVTNRKGTVRCMTALSVGGGMIEVTRIDQIPLSIGGNFHEYLAWGTAQEIENRVVSLRERFPTGVCFKVWKSTESAFLQISSETDLHLDGDYLHLPPVLPVLGDRAVSKPLAALANLRLSRDLSQAKASEVALDYEAERSGKSPDEIRQMATAMLQTMRTSIEIGLQGSDYQDRLLEYRSRRILEYSRQSRLLPGDWTNHCLAYTIATLEAKSAMEVIIATPTAGSCGVVPGAILSAGEALSLLEERIAEAILAAGITGIYILERATFAAEVAGCQAECGVAGAMAAAGLMEMMGGSAQSAFDAASVALQNLLGLICDPIGNRVEAPCLGRNVTAAYGAIASVNLVLCGMPPLIPLEETADAMLAVGKMLPRELRCTALGGLSITPSAQTISQRFNDD